MFLLIRIIGVVQRVAYIIRSVLSPAFIRPVFVLIASNHRGYKTYRREDTCRGTHQGDKNKQKKISP